MTKVLVVVDNHLIQTPDGRVWSNGIYDYSFFARYLAGFDEVFVAVRIAQMSDNIDYPNLCSGKDVYFLPLQEFKGAAQYLKQYHTVKRQIREFVNNFDAFIIRTPSAISFQFIRFIDGKKPYALEIVADPWDHFSLGASKTILRPIIRIVMTLLQKYYCMRANGVAYVTERFLQKRYPCKALRSDLSGSFFTSWYSSVNLPQDFFDEPKKYDKKTHWNLIHAANEINNYGKGHLEAIKAVKKLNQAGIDVNVYFAGDGPLVNQFMREADRNGVLSKVHFIGRLTRKTDMKQFLRNGDIFIFPSHAEGLPRVLIESMAVGTPCVASNVNGIPELLPEDQMASVGDVDGIAEIIQNLINNPERMNQISIAGVEKAKKYAEPVLQERRAAFYIKLRNLLG